MSSKLLLKKYEELMHAGSFIPCGKMKHTLNELSWTGWIDRMVLERLLEKSAGIHIMLQENKQHWEQTCWWMMARNFGIRVNADAFESIARSLPLHIISRHKQQLHQVEALLFGQAGLLEGKFTEDYPQLLQKEYRFLAKKYRLKPVPVSLLFLRMRPANFPSVRLAQLAILLHQGSHLFDQIRLAEKLDTIRDLLKLTANDYWHYHYVFDEPSGFMEKKLGKQMVENILINTVIPILFAHAGFHNNQAVKQKVLDWLREIPAEKNSIMTGFTDLGYPCRHAMDSQALLHLKKNYCNRKNCLSCVIGNNLLSPHQ